MPAEDAGENDLSVREDFRIVSAYSVGTGKAWLIAEADRLSTGILLPEDH